MTKTIVEFPDQGVVSEEAAEWLIRLDADTPPTYQEVATLGEWLNRSPAHREELESLATLWGRMNVLTELVVPLGKLHRETLGSRPEHASRRSARMRMALIAASVIGGLTLGFVLLLRGPATDPLTADNGLYATAVGQQTTTTLPDGSQIMLNTNSQIRVIYSDQYRQVHLLQGEALFTVAKNPDRPFRVYAGGGRIQALGTAFSVYLKDKDIQVTVAQGSVALATVDSSRPKTPTPKASAGGRPDGTVPGVTAGDEWAESLGTLNAGQVATIRRQGEETAATDSTVSRISEPVSPKELAERLAWRDGILMFSGDRLEDVVKEVSRYTTISIEIPDRAIRDTRIGGRFPVGEIDVMLTALETNFNLTVTRLGHNRVILSAANE